MIGCTPGRRQWGEVALVGAAGSNSSENPHPAEMMELSLAGALRDSSIYSDPDTFDIDRDVRELVATLVGTV